MSAISLALRVDSAHAGRLERALRDHPAFQERRRPAAFAESWCDTLDFDLAEKGYYHRGAPEALKDHDRQRLGKSAKKLAVQIGFRGRRTVFLLGGRHWTAEVSLDQGVAQAGRRQRDLARATFRMTKGRWSAGGRLIQSLLEAVPARFEFQEGAHLTDWARGRLVGARKARPMALEEGATLGQAFQSILASILDHLAVNAEGVKGRDTLEPIHQVRVALRRLRSVLALFAPLFADPLRRALSERAKALASALGPVRDHDVFAADILGPVRQAFSAETTLDLLAAHLKHQRQAALKTAREAVASPAFNALLIDLFVEAADLADHPPAGAPTLADFARQRLETRWRKLVKERRPLSALSGAARHQQRIRAKKLRYAMEFLIDLYPGKRARKTRARLEALLDALGQLNDIEAARARLASVDEAKVPAAHRHAIGLIAGWHAARERRLLEQAEGPWQAFRRAKKFWL